jgi:hypothetical protein
VPMGTALQLASVEAGAEPLDDANARRQSMRILKGAIGFVIAATVVAVAITAGARGDAGSASAGASGATEVPGGAAPGDPGGGSDGSGAGGGSAGGGGSGVGDGPIATEPCGEHIEGTGPDGVVSYTLCPGDEPPTPDPGPQIVEPRPGMADVYARPFDSATVGDDDVTVRVDFVSGIEPCSVLDHVDVGYGADTVTITLFEGHDPDAGAVACIEIGVFKRVIVTLDQPLGDRDIVDGAAR